MTALNHAGNAYAARLAAQARTPEQFKVESRIYFHHHNYAKFHFDLGGSNVKTVPFANHRYITDDKREQDQLDLVADVPGTFIYTLADSDVARAMAQELQKEQVGDVLRTAAASAAVHNQQFDPNAPIVPVNVQHVQPTGMTVAAVSQQAIVGLQNSMSGTSAVDIARATQQAKVAAPDAVAEAKARLDAVAKGG